MGNQSWKNWEVSIVYAHLFLRKLIMSSELPALDDLISTFDPRLFTADSSNELPDYEDHDSLFDGSDFGSERIFGSEDSLSDISDMELEYIDELEDDVVAVVANDIETTASRSTPVKRHHDICENPDQESDIEQGEHTLLSGQMHGVPSFDFGKVWVLGVHGTDEEEGVDADFGRGRGADSTVVTEGSDVFDMARLSAPSQSHLDGGDGDDGGEFAFEYAANDDEREIALTGDVVSNGVGSELDDGDADDEGESELEEGEIKEDYEWSKSIGATFGEGLGGGMIAGGTRWSVPKGPRDDHSSGTESDTSSESESDNTSESLGYDSDSVGEDTEDDDSEPDLITGVSPLKPDQDFIVTPEMWNNATRTMKRAYDEREYAEEDHIHKRRRKGPIITTDIDEGMHFD